MPDSPGEKTEAPTPRRRSEARDEGNVARSQDLSAAISLLGAVLLLGMFGMGLFEGFHLLVRSLLGGDWSEDLARSGDVGHLFAMATSVGGQVVIPLVLGMLTLGVVANVLQVGFMFTGKPLVPKFSKLSPVKGFKNLVSMKAMMRFVMAMSKVAIVLAVSAVTIYFDIPKVVHLITLDAGPMLAAASGLVYTLALRIAIVLLILALLDFMYQKWQHEQDLKMSKEEVKQEMKNMEGDPLVKQRRAKVARQLAMQRINQAVPEADVIVTNPTHFAIALKYDENMIAPTVVAKGVDFMAMRIRQLGAANGVPIVERPPLARALYKHVEVNEQIPAKYYGAVAEILAYVYRLNQSAKSPANAALQG